MKALIACEFSGVVRDAFITKGHEAISCDFLPTESPGPHHHGDVIELLQDPWDLVIAHPPCTYLTSSAEWAYSDGPYHQKVGEGVLVGAERRAARQKAIDFVTWIYECANSPRIAIENPVGVLSTVWREPDQYIHPYEYGDNASKKTCLWLKNLPLLRPTGLATPRLAPSGKGYALRWANQTDSGQSREQPSADRWKVRSTTWPGWAEAMADQWGSL